MWIVLKIKLNKNTLVKCNVHGTAKLILLAYIFQVAEVYLEKAFKGKMEMALWWDSSELLRFTEVKDEKKIR